MLKKLLKIVFLFTMFFSYSQEFYKVNFNLKGSIAVYKNSKLIKDNCQTLTANINTNLGKFNIILIDVNNNDSFLDYRKIGSKIGSDILLIGDYRKKISKIELYQARYLTKLYPISINGKTFMLSDFKKEKNGFYTARLIQKKILLTDFVKNKNGVIIDHLPNYNLFDLKKDTIVVDDFLKKYKFLYVHFYTDDDWSFFTEPNKLRYLELKYPNLHVISFGIVDNLSNFKKMLKESSIEEDEIILLSKKKLKQLLNMGYNFSILNGILFNQKGKVMASNLNADMLKNELFILSKRNKKN